MIDSITGSDIKISVSIPVKTRPYADYRKSIDALQRLAKYKDNIELCFFIDTSDKELIATLPALPWGNRKIIVGNNPDGSLHLERLHNELFRISNGDLFMIWSDDCIIKTPEWDELILKAWQGEPIQVFKIGKKLQFPVFTRPYVYVQGQIARHTVDSYIEFLVDALPIVTDVPKIDYELRRDDDKDPKRNETNKRIHDEFFSQEVQDMILEDRLKVRNALR